MTATKGCIERWIKEAQARECSHLIIACDTYDHNNYPVYCHDNVQFKINHLGNMQMVDEVYSFTGKYTVESQLKEKRAKHYD